MPATVGGYWGTLQFAHDLPLPVIYSQSAGLQFEPSLTISPPFDAVAGDTLLMICNIRNQSGEANLSYITSVSGDWTLIGEYSAPPPNPNPSHQYIYRKVASASETAYTIVRDGINGPGFMNAAILAIEGAGPIEHWANAAPPPPHYIPAITTAKPNTLLVLAYTAKDPLDQFIPMPPSAPIWIAVGGAYFGSHYSSYQRDAVVEGTYGPTTTHGGTTHAHDQYTVMAISPLPAAPTPDLTITELEPNAGLIGGGTTVTVHGTSFALGATTVTIGAVTIPAGSVTVTGGTTLTFVTPAAPAGVTTVKNVTVTVGAYTSNPVPFTYNTGGFSPSQIDDLLYWLDASEPSTVTLGGTGGVEVTRWRDLSVTGYAFDPPSGGRPTYTATVFGRNVMTWTADHFICTQLVRNVQPYTFAWVMNPTLSGTRLTVYSQVYNGPWIEIASTGTLVLFAGFERDTGVATAGLHTWVVVLDGARSQVWKDGVLAWEGTEAFHPGTTFGPGTPQIGNHTHGTTNFTGIMPEFAVYEAKLAAADRTDLIQSWLDKWGIGGTAPTPPGAPTLNSATAASPTSVALVWTAPASNGGASIVHYPIERSANGTTGWTEVTRSDSTATSYTVTGLTTGTIQYFRVSAENSIGTGSPSNVLSATPVATVPGAPVLNTAAAGNTTVALSWSAPSDGGSALTDYIIEQSADGTTGWGTVTESVSTATSYTVTGLTNEVIQYFRIKAVNAIGPGAASNVRSATPTIAPEFAPDDLSGLIGWFDADDTSTMDFDASPRPKVFHSKVGTMVCGNDTAATRPTRETMPNGLQYLAFDGTTFLRGDSPYESPNCITTTTVTVCALVRKDANNGYGRMFSFHDPAAGSEDYNNVGSFVIASYGPTNSFPSVDRNSAVGFVRDTATNVGVWSNLAVEFSGTNGTLYNNGTTFGPTGSTGTFSVDRFWIGARTGGIEAGIGSFAEVCIYNRVLTTLERSQVYDYFDAKWLDVEAVAPGAPTLNSATAGNAYVGLAWTAGSTGGSAIIDYIIEKSPNGTSTWTTVSESESAATSYTVTGLANDVIQYFRVSAVNAVGPSSPSNVMSATPTDTGPFDPTALPNLVGWWKADTGVTGSPVSQWNDQSGNGRHLVQATSGERPTIGTVGGKLCLTFNDDWLLWTGTDAITGSTMSAFVKVRVPASGSGRLLSVGYDGYDWLAATGAHAMGWEDSEFPSGYRNSSKLSHAGAPTLNTWMHCTSLFNGTNHTMYTNRTGHTPAGSTGNFDVSRIGIGSDYNGSGRGNFNIAEIIIYSDAKDATARAAIWDYLEAT